MLKVNYDDEEEDDDNDMINVFKEDEKKIIESHSLSLSSLLLCVISHFVHCYFSNQARKKLSQSNPNRSSLPVLMASLN